jgi:hemerythrin superfamily protein
MTSTRPRRQADVLELLTEQHRQVDDLIEKLQADDLDAAAKLATFRTLADCIAAHTAMEEQLFYPMVRANQTEDQLLESTEEHLAIKRVLADMLGEDIAAARFAAKLSVLKEELSHHAHVEEERKLFPKVRKLLSADEREALGAECLSLFEQLMAAEPRNWVPEQTREAARL